MAYCGEHQIVGNGIDDRRGGSAAVEKYGVVFVDQRCGQQADTTLFRDLFGLLIGDKIVGDAIAAGIGDHIATQQHHGGRFRAEIAADGHF
ncbi:hypothetical protein D3C78_1561480 [compost metagenome]